MPSEILRREDWSDVPYPCVEASQILKEHQYRINTARIIYNESETELRHLRDKGTLTNSEYDAANLRVYAHYERICEAAEAIRRKRLEIVGVKFDAE